MPTQTQPKIPNPIYAAAGAGDLAIERLRKLPEQVAVLQDRVSALQDELPARMTVIGDKVTQKVAEIPSLVAELRQRVVDTDTDRLRESARRNATQFMASAQAAQEKAVAIYTELVARGQGVVAGAPAERQAPVHAEVVANETATVDLTEAVADAAEPTIEPKATKPASKPRKSS
jgi:heparin binding hemagglutinin HbhA